MRSSRSICSSAESTSLRVESWCCASTTRHGVSRSARISESPAHRVQILDDIDESLHRLDAFGRHGREMIVERGKPLARFHVVATDQRVETAIEPQEEECELALLGLGIESAPMLQTRD